MTTTLDSFNAWAGEPPAGERDYFRGVARARFVIRKVFRIIDECARRAGLEPLHHQALLQAFGGPEGGMRVNELGDRLDVSAALASRLVSELEASGYVRRERSDADRRVTRVSATEGGQRILAAIDDDVHLHVGYFQHQLTDADRAAALRVVAFYAGAAMPRG